MAATLCDTLVASDPLAVEPLSFNQEVIVFLCEAYDAGGDVTSQNAVRYAEIRGEVDLRALEDAMNVVSGRHDALRTRFLREDSGWAQVVETECSVAPTHIDLLHIDDIEDRLAELRARAHDLHFEPFDLDRAPLWAITVFTYAPDAHVLQIRLCHLIADMRAGEVVHDELDVEYRRALGESPAPLSPAVQYGVHRREQRERLDRFLHGADTAEQWREVVAYRKQMQFGLRQASRMVPMELAPGRARAGTMSALDETLSTETVRGLRRVARTYGVTVSIVCVAALHRALRSWSGMDRVVLWSEKSVRPREMTNAVGTFSDAMMFVTDVDPARPFSELVDDVTRQQEEFIGTDAVLIAGLHADPSLLEEIRGRFATSQRVFYQYFGQPEPWRSDAVLQPTSLVQPFDFQDGAIDIHCCVIASQRSIRVRVRWDDGLFDESDTAELHALFLDELEVAACGETPS